MKKIILAISLSVLFLPVINAQSEESEGGCPHKDLIREFVKASDTMARFIDNVKSASSPTAWANLLDDVLNSDADLSAFNNLGADSASIKATYSTLGDSLDVYMAKLAHLVNPNGLLSIQEVKDSINSLISCYLTDTIENSFSVLVEAAGRFAPDLGSYGPCEREARNCLSSASQSYTQNLIACGFGGAGVSALPKAGWWGLASGLGCFILANSSYNSAKWTCFENYIDCTGG